MRMLLLSISDLRPPFDSWGRIERLYHLNGGRLVGIVFLLDAASGHEDSIVAYMDLQAKYYHLSLELLLNSSNYIQGF
jgi:hypothetical protein